MRWRRVADLVFWTLFIPYVLGLVVWLVVGLAPAAVGAVPGLHQALHDRGGDALRAGAEVVLEVENLDGEAAHGIAMVGEEGAQPVFQAEPVPAGGTASFRFTAPGIGSYSFVGDDGDVGGEIRFTDDGARSLRLQTDGDRIEKVGRGLWAGVAQRVADASHRADHGVRVALESVFSALNLGLGVLLLVRRPRDRTAQLLAVAMIGTAATFNHQSHSVLKLGLIGDQELLHLLFHLASGLAYIYAVIVFPDGRLVPSWPAWSGGRWAVRALYAYFTLLVTAVVLYAASESHPGQPFFTVLFGVLVPLAGFAAQTERLRRTSDPVARQQSLLLRWALVPMLAGGIGYLALTAAPGPEVEELGPAVFPALFAVIPVALVVGILRYRLWDIDVIISKTLLSLGLAGFIGAVYVGVVVLLGGAIGTTGSTTGLQIAATAIAAVAFGPVRARLQRFANRLVYGERETPYEVMADFSRRVAGGLSVDEILPGLARATGRGIGAVATRVSVLLPGGGSRTVSWPPGAGDAASTRTVPVAHGGQAVGEIAVAKAAGEELTAAEEELLSALAAQAGLAFNNVRLAVELQARLEEVSAQADELRASRQRIVTSREGLRQRVVGTIHDRVEVRLEGIEATLRGVERNLHTDPPAVLRQLDAVAAEASDALEALRDLARGIFPPLLADRGVLSALEAHATKAQLFLRIDADGLAGGQRYDPQAEASIFFCLVEALRDTGRGVSDEPVSVRLAGDDARLTFSVAGAGRQVVADGLVASPDVQGMRDRVEAVGGEMEVRSSPGDALVVSGWVPARILVGASASPGRAR